MNVLLLAVCFLHTVSHVFGRPENDVNDPKIRTTRSPQGNTVRNDRRYKYSINLLHIDDGTIIFPHEEKHHHHNHSFKMPKIKPISCQNNICEDLDDYPAEYVDKVLASSKEFQDYFSRQSQDDSFIVSDRVGYTDAEEQTLCSASVIKQLPQGSANLNGTFLGIVNTDTFQQIVVTETCISKDLKCKFSNLFPDNYETGCKQKFTNHRLLAFDFASGDKKSFVDLFRIPSCCVCYFKKKEL